MKKFTKVIASVLAGVMAALTLATSASAAEYIDNDGTYWTDGVYDGKVYVEDDYGYYYDLDDFYTYNSCYDYYNYNYNYDLYRYNTTYTEVYVGYDAFFGNIYYITDCGYYAVNGYKTTYLGTNFVFTEYVGRDSAGRNIYFRSEYGYIYYNNNNSSWYSLGYNINNIAW